MKTVIISKQEQAENFVIEMDMVQSELEQTGDYEVFESCKRSLELLKCEIASLGYEVKRVPTGWMLVEEDIDQYAERTYDEMVKVPGLQEEEVAQVASTPTIELHEDEQGLYAEVPSSQGKTNYTVRVCAKWLYSVSCDCAARGDCRHRQSIDRAFDSVRPTFSEQSRGVTVSGETLNRLLYGDRYAAPLKGSGVTGFKAASIAAKLVA